jgi:hypothetical protein
MDASTTRRKARRLSSVVVVDAPVLDVPAAHAVEPSATPTTENDLTLLGCLVSPKLGRRFAERGRRIAP